MEDESGEVQTLLRQLGTDEPDRAWDVFVETYGPILLQVARHLERDPDAARDCFVFLCEQLAAGRFRRLRNYGPREKATFTTWLRCVARNLCIDWQRSRSGRRRPFAAIRGLTAVEQRVFELYFVQRRDLHETTAVARAEFSEATKASISAAVDRVGALLSPRQRWLLSSRGVRLESLDDDRAEPPPSAAQDRESPERRLLEKERRSRLAASLGQLSSDELRLLKLRFEEDRSLRVCADDLGLENPQKADRMIRAIVSRLRAKLSE